MNAVASVDTNTRRDALIERILASCGGGFDIYAMYIGERLGYYSALAESGGLTPRALADRTGTNERYVREWLEQQATTGVLEAERSSDGSWLFSLPEGHTEVLTDSNSPNFLLPLARCFVGAARPIDDVLKAFRTGGGVAFEQYGADLREGQAAINRVTFLEDLPSIWIPAMPDVHARLQDPSGASVADIGCGGGWSGIGIASAYPGVSVDGYDLDRASVELARENAEQAGLSDRVRFHLTDAGDPSLAGQYDLVCAFECVHDMSDPVSVLAAMRRLAGSDGAALVVDERVSDEFSTSPGDVDWMMYGWSILHCLPAGMADQPSVGTGTVMRSSTLESYAKKAGFAEVEILDVDNFFFRLYRLRQ